MPEGRNTTQQGNDFRDRVKQLLELTPGCVEVKAEYPIGTQPVDLYYEEQTSFRLMRVACECKDYGRALTKDLIARDVYPRYAPLLQNKLVDAVRIIAPVDLGATAHAYVAECGFTFHTIDQLETQLVDFRQYLRALKGAYAEDGLDQYYVRPLLDDGRDVETVVGAWIEGGSSQPVAILAGYGMGKTSFARHLAFRLAERSLRDPTRRIPILIPLSEISGEQALEGLLGKLLAAQHRIPGYHFGLFNELNRRGRFVILLDGFDEMKHAMSWADFKYNFGQLNRLNGANSRVVLLGRPSALLSEDEEIYVLRGKRRTGNRLLTVAGAPEYRELRLAEFSVERATEFMLSYASYRARMDSVLRGQALASVDVNHRIEALRQDPEMTALIVRPVQAKMLADLAIDPDTTWRSFTRYELYKEFIERITERESRKPTRARFPQQSRLSFIRKVAWWAWRRSSSLGFNIDELPASTLNPIPGDLAANTDGVLRDLVAGSLLEKKAGENYYFPHRSFLEFLVAEFICIEGAERMEDISASLTPEIESFVRESPHAKVVAEWREDVNGVEGALGMTFLKLIAWALNAVNSANPGELLPDATPQDVMIAYFRLIERGPVGEMANRLCDGFDELANPRTRVACLLALLLIEGVKDPALQELLRKKILVFLLTESLDSIKRVLEPGRAVHITMDKRSPFMHMLVNSCSGSWRDGELFIGMQVDSLFRAIQEILLPELQIDIAPLSCPGSFPAIPLSQLGVLDERLLLNACIAEFFTLYPDPSKLVRSERAAGRRIQFNRL